MMTFVFLIAIVMIIGSILAIIVSTIEYFIYNELTKENVQEYKTTLKIFSIILCIGIIIAQIYIHFEGIPQILGW